MDESVSKYLLLVLGSLILSVGLSGCLTEPASQPVVAKAEFFDGVRSVQNLGGDVFGSGKSSSKIVWDSAAGDIAKYRVYLFNKSTGALSLLTTVSADKTSYIHSGTTPGDIYSYVVRAVNADGEEDPNTKIVSTVAYLGIMSASQSYDSISEQRTVAKLNLNSTMGSVDKVRIYSQDVITGAEELLAEIPSTLIAYSVTGLKSGVRYRFIARAYNSALGIEDGNTRASSVVRTASYAYDGTDYQYQSVSNVQAYGPAPNAPVDQPTTSQVVLSYQPFLNSDATTRYRIYRVKFGGAFDFSSTTQCTVNTTSSCLVACTQDDSSLKTELTGSDSTALSCRDKAVKDAPMSYDYVIVRELKRTTSTGATESWFEEPPIVSDPVTNYVNAESRDPFRITVTIPPENMALVQRDAVNREMCFLMGRTVDPKYFNRCVFKGAGATIKNANPGKLALNGYMVSSTDDGQYYDFGYNLMVDRWEAGCNWSRKTSSTNPGMCVQGAGATPTSGNCIGIVGGISNSPASYNWSGADGNIFFAIDTGRCYIRKGTSWFHINNLTAAGDASYHNKAYTADPQSDKKTPPFVEMTQALAASICSNSDVTAYGGKKRLLRLREWMAAAAWPVIPGEPRSMGVREIMDSDFGDMPHTCNTHYLRYNNPNTYGYDRRDILLAKNTPGQEAANILNYPVDAPYLATSTANSTTGDPQTTNSNVDRNLGLGRQTVFLGNQATRACISRYGVQDMVGNVGEWVSDAISKPLTVGLPSLTMTGTDSSIFGDPGNNAIDGLNLGDNIWYLTSSTKYTTTKNLFSSLAWGTLPNASLAGYVDCNDPKIVALGSTEGICFVMRNAVTSYATLSHNGVWDVPTYFNYALGLPMKLEPNSEPGFSLWDHFRMSPYGQFFTGGNAVGMAYFTQYPHNAPAVGYVGVAISSNFGSMTNGSRYSVSVGNYYGFATLARGFRCGFGVDLSDYTK